MARRILPDPNPRQRQALDAVEAAAAARRAADQAYIEAVCAAAETGLTPTQIAPATGGTRQAVEQLVKRHAD